MKKKGGSLWAQPVRRIFNFSKQPGLHISISNPRILKQPGLMIERLEYVVGSSLRKTADPVAQEVL